MPRRSRATKPRGARNPERFRSDSQDFRDSSQLGGLNPGSADHCLAGGKSRYFSGACAAFCSCGSPNAEVRAIRRYREMGDENESRTKIDVIGNIAGFDRKVGQFPMKSPFHPLFPVKPVVNLNA
jgi:hypothetical protein